MKILVTGSKGFIASHLNFEFDGIDIGEKIPNKKYDVVVCLGALMKDEPDMYENNVSHLKECVDYCKKNVAHLIFASSAAFYGDADILPTPEDYPASSINKYGASKVAGETQIITNLFSKYTIFRLSNVYPKEDSAWGRFKRGEKIYGDGTQVRDFIHVDEVVKAIKIAMGYKIYGVYNLSSGRGITINRFYRDNFGEPEYEPAPKEEIRVSILDNTKWNEKVKNIKA